MRGRVLSKRLWPIVLLAVSVSACGEDKIVTGTGAPSQPRERKDEAAEVQEESEIPPAVDFQEAAFVESERSRDPFRNYARAFVDDARGAVRSQRDVILEDYAIEELKLIGIVTGANPNRAMLLDPAGVGHVVTRGQFVGRATVVQPSGGVGAAYEVNWRVDRIRDGDLVLVRDDPSNPDVPSATRVIPLRTDELTAEGAPQQGEEELKSQLDELKERLAQMEAAEATRRRKRSNKETESR